MPVFHRQWVRHRFVTSGSNLHPRIADGSRKRPSEEEKKEMECSAGGGPKAESFAGAKNKTEKLGVGVRKGSKRGVTKGEIITIL